MFRYAAEMLRISEFDNYNESTQEVTFVDIPPIPVVNAMLETVICCHQDLNTINLVIYRYILAKLGTCESEIFVPIELQIESAATIRIESRIESGCSRLHVQELCRPTAGNYPNACYVVM